MALYKGDGTKLTRTTLGNITTADPDPYVTLNEAVYEDAQYEAGGSVEASPAATKILKWAAGHKLRTSELDKAYGASVVSSVAPNTGPAAGGTVVVINGSGFAKGTKVLGGGGVAPVGTATVTFGGTAATAVKVLSDTQIQCTTPAHAAGAVAVQVTTGGGATSAAGAYTYV